MSLKITLIGAGSVIFAKNLLGDVLQFPELSDATICLVDVDPVRLEVATIMARRMAAKLGVAAKIEATLDQRQAIKGARYVICAIQVGGYRPATVLDFEIPKKYGLRQTIGDTLGVGGIFRGLRTIPVINKIAEDIAAVGAPGCLLLNYTNPMAMCCWGVARAVGIPHVGLCHSVQITSSQLAGYLGLAYDKVTYLVAGINHMAFFLRLEFAGQDAYPLLFRKLEDPAFDHDRVRFEMMRRTGYFVTESSEHQSEYLPYFIPHGEKIISKFNIPLDEYLRRCEGVIKTWKETEAQLLGNGGDIEVGPQSREYGAFIIHSRETGAPRTIYGNVPNTGLITNLPPGCCVEVPCLVDSRGLHPNPVGDLPPQLAMLCQSNISTQALTVEAALTRKREHIYHAVMSDPNTAATLTLDQMWAMCDELIEAHQKIGLLGPFAPTIRGTGRSFAGIGDRVIVEIGYTDDGKSFAAKVSNGRSHPVALRLAIALQSLEGEVLARETLSIVADAGKTMTEPIQLQVPSAIHKGFRVTAESSLDDVLLISLEAAPRKILYAGGEKPALEISLAGTPAVKGWIDAVGPDLQLRFQVDDSKVTPHELPWYGSSLELFFAPENSGTALQTILAAGKGKEGPRFVYSHINPVPGARLRQSANRSGYEIEATVPKASLGLPPDAKAFLLDCYANLSALGDAHSGGRASLSGSFEAHCGASFYSRVELPSPAERTE
jgi:alpha-galactosidase/6-phospho-beta-glucosidase family protein